MTLDVRRFAVAVATVWATASLICAFVFKAAPEVYASTANFLVHTDMYRVVRSVGWGELLLAVLVWWVIVASVVGASAALYNTLMACERDVARQPAARIAGKA